MPTEAPPPQMAADARGAAEGVATTSDDPTAPSAPPAPFLHMPAQLLQAPAPRPMRIALHAAALLLAIGALVAECILISHHGFTYEWMTGTRIATAPALVIATAAIAAVLANVLLVSTLLRAAPSEALPSYQPVPVSSAAADRDGVPPAPVALWHAAVEAGLFACVTALWIASVGVSGRTQGFNMWFYMAQGTMWERCNIAVLVFECASVLVWGASLFLVARPLAPVVQAWWAQCAASAGPDSPVGGLLGSHPLMPPTTTTALVELDQGPAVRKLRLALHVLTALVSIGTIVAQAVFMQHRDLPGYGDYYWTDGKHYAVAPGLVIATAVVALVTAGGLLTARVFGQRLQARRGICRSQALRVVCLEAALAVAVFALWVASLAVSGRTARKLDKIGHGAPKLWVHANVAVVVFEAISVLAWGVTLVLAARPLLPVVQEWRARRAAMAGGFYEPLEDAETAAAAGDDSGSTPRSEATSTGGARPAAQAQPARMVTLATAALLSVGALVAQLILMRYPSWATADFSYYYVTRGQSLATSPQLVLATAIAALSASTVLLACLAAAACTRLPRWWAPSGMAAWAAGAEVALVSAILALWGASIGVSASTAHMLLKHTDPSSYGTQPGRGVWIGGNAAVMVFESCSVVAWAAALAFSVMALVRAWRERRPADVSIIKATPVAVTQLPRVALLVVTVLLAVGVIVAENALLNHWAEVLFNYYGYYWWRGTHFAMAPPLVFTAAGTAIFAACVLLLTALVPWFRAANWDPRASPTSRMPSVAAATEVALVTVVLALWVASVGVSAKTAATLRKPQHVSRDWVHSNAAALVLECCSVLAWAAALALSVGSLLRARAARKESLAASSELRALLSDDEHGGSSGSSTPRTTSTTSSDKPQPAAVQPARIALYLTAFLVGIGTLVAQGILMNYSTYPDFYPYEYTKGKNVAAAPGLVIFTASVTVLLAAIKLAASVPAIVGLPLFRAAVSTPSLQLWVATAEAELAAMVLALWAASLGVSARNAHRWRHSSSWAGVWVRCNAAVLAFACISVCLWMAGAVLSFRALRAAVRAWQGERTSAVPQIRSGAASRAGSVASDAA